MPARADCSQGVLVVFVINEAKDLIYEGKHAKAIKKLDEYSLHASEMVRQTSQKDRVCPCCQHGSRVQ